MGCGAGAGEFGEMVYGHFFLLAKEYHSWKKKRKNIIILS